MIFLKETIASTIRVIMTAKCYRELPMEGPLKLLRRLMLPLLLLLPLSASLQTDNSGAVHVFTLDGAIGPAVSAWLEQGFVSAREQSAHLIVIQMDTPGGLDTAMRDIIQGILDSDVPVATYVHPQGARAASAGTYILYASHIAAMAPATNLGAATPVQVGMPSIPSPAGSQEEGEEEQESAGTMGMSATERKAINDATAYIRSLAELNGRNAEWAVQAVTEAASLSANEALAAGVIDLVASDLADLLQQLQGRELVVKGRTVVLDTTGRPIVHEAMGWHTRILTVLTNPSLILILGMIGLYGLIIEFYSPGFGLGGITGVICLLLAAYGLQLLPINYAGLGLILLGLALMVGEALVPSFGLLGAGGIIAFLMGGIMLVDTEIDVFQISTGLLLAIAVFSAALVIITLRMFTRIKHKPVVSGIELLQGQTGESVAAFEQQGVVKIQGELWQALTDTPLQAGDKIKVLYVDGLHLKVTRA
jgi:membrane-bound serine protease (ClpP class)